MFSKHILSTSKLKDVNVFMEQLGEGIKIHEIFENSNCHSYGDYQNETHICFPYQMTHGKWRNLHN